MSYGAARARYADETAHTASPARLLTMVYDRLVSDLASAEEAMNSGDIAQTGERLGRAQEILLELRASLDTTVWPEGEALGALYLWMVGELMQARLRQSPDRVRQCRELVEPLRDAWRTAAVETVTGGAATAGTATAATGTAQTGTAQGVAGASATGGGGPAAAGAGDDAGAEATRGMAVVGAGAGASTPVGAGAARAAWEGSR